MFTANQHHKSAISVVRVGGDGSNTCNDGTCGESDEDKSDDKGEINSHVNLTVEGFYPPAHVMAPPAQSLPTSVVVQPTTTPAVETTAIVEPDSQYLLMNCVLLYGPKRNDEKCRLC